MSKVKKLFNKWYKDADQIPPVRIVTLSREKFVGLFNEFGFKKGAEIGVDRGSFSSVILKNNPDLFLYCVDPWQIRDGEKRYKTTLSRLEKYNDRFKIIRKNSLDAINEIEDGSLDFVYIDGDHTFDYIMLDLILWSKKVKEGGIVCGHDYYRFRNAGVIEAVDLYTKMHKIEKWFITDYLKDRTPSFFWVKK